MSSAVYSGRKLDLLIFALAALASAGLLLWAIGDWVFAIVFLAGLVGSAGLLRFWSGSRPLPLAEPAVLEPVDTLLLRSALDLAQPDRALAVTDSDGELICANQMWGRWFGPASPIELVDGEERNALEGALRSARRDGEGRVDGLRIDDRRFDVQLKPAGSAEAQFVWSFDRPSQDDLAEDSKRLIQSDWGRLLGDAGLLAIVTDDKGRIEAANDAFVQRAMKEDQPESRKGDLVDFLMASETGQFHLSTEGLEGPPLRIVQIPTGPGESESLFLLMDDLPGAAIGKDQNSHIHALLDILPLGLALADTDGRFTFINKVFRRSVGLGQQERPVWPGDLVVDEDKGAVSDAVRRFSRGRALSGDLAVRLKSNPEEPVAMTVAGARGLGNAAVLMSLKDNSEEARLKREIAQATKMQAVGQLAGGVAHDFNNILTAILGTCDLMLMRHTPGDSDYDDIQQIRSNSNRAASLTRQLLAFSRQQTLRPQVLQLPDVVAEVSHLLTRLIGERIKLQVKHGRGLGAVRADPGQLEQVIVNLAVNGRDAMLAKDPSGGGTLTLRTFAVTAEEVRRMGTDILPIGEYTALEVSDTGIGIQPHVIGKIFEPFFTTKEVGKGTGLGLSTVYGIVKQSGGFIFAESVVRGGTTFTIYLPVHRSSSEGPARKVKAKAGELWGTGTILLVEDESMVRAVAERALTRHGYTVLSAENGEAALEILAREDKIDLMISDVVMPSMDGPTTVRHARLSHPELPILFISGYAEEQLRKSIDIPNVSFLAKPFSVQLLAETVRDVLGTK